MAVKDIKSKSSKQAYSKKLKPASIAKHASILGKLGGRPVGQAKS